MRRKNRKFDQEKSLRNLSLNIFSLVRPIITYEMVAWAERTKLDTTRQLVNRKQRFTIVCISVEKETQFDYSPFTPIRKIGRDWKPKRDWRVKRWIYVLLDRRECFWCHTRGSNTTKEVGAEALNQKSNKVWWESLCMMRIIDVRNRGFNELENQNICLDHTQRTPLFK